MKKFFLLLIIISFNLNAQIKDSLPDFSDEYFLVKDGDTLMIKLDEVPVLPKHKFKSRKDVNYYYWFRKKVFKAYPYATLASKRIDSLHARLDRIESNRKKRKYVKRVQKYLEKELTGQIKKMTRTEGRVLIKLIHRQTGKTVFENIREFRSGWKAFWYNTTANVFKLSLKDEYQPELANEDYLIEDILQRAFIDEALELQEPKLEIDSYKILEQKKGAIDVEEYKKMFAKMKKKKKRKKKKK
ncbi:DUF4294 domain-containing protein [Tenacibaculum jejuense]|uniref:DUF4294 domain-containing protein n=1 Tax=Tenacibaculum jejuense TaxID=584609 RepID=A0A238U8C5_9FLAO|nr:DUF4294 domain-containing protein [Tenacibaculum jejuense]SNR15352.1 Protein of unknown function precursor [Tenacibaculum jejuense]